MPDLSDNQKPLRDQIRAQIQERGPVPFAWFMEQALYHPDHGYYTGETARVGRDGDFFTSVSVGSAFGRVLTLQFIEMWQRLNSPGQFTIIEQGANDGQLAIDVLSAAENLDPTFHQAVDYLIVEPSPALTKRQQAHIPQSLRDKVSWTAALSDVPASSVTGVHFSNELLDAMPVHLVQWNGNAWQELMVAITDDAFTFLPHPITNPALASQIQTLPSDLSEGYRTEVNLAAIRWTTEVTRILDRGFLLLIDYGLSRSDYYQPERTEGTLSCYAQHRRSDDPLTDPGSTDITTHIEFTSVAATAIANGLELAGFADQHHFMIGAARDELLRIEKFPATPATTEFIARFKTLMHPGTMGQAFKFLCFEKNVASSSPLSGFAFSRNPHQALGLE